MLTRKIILGIFIAILMWMSTTRADYTYVVTVGQDPNETYDCNTIQEAIDLMNTYEPNETNLGCIQVY